MSLCLTLAPFCLSRENLKQWEKVMKGEEAYGWLPAQQDETETSDSLPVKIDD